MTVWIVFYLYYDDFETIGVYANKQTAEQIAESIEREHPDGSCTIEEHKVEESLS